MARYAKGVEGVDHYYQPEDLYKYAGEQFDVRLSILDESPEIGLWATVDGEEIGKPIGELLDELVVGRDPDLTEFVREHMLDLDEFPHLSDALDKMADIWQRFRKGEAKLSICVNGGADDIAIEDTAREHMSTCVWQDGSLDYMLLDLVLEPSELTLAGMLGNRKQDFLLWLQGLLAMYKLDLEPGSEKILRKRKDLEPVREQLLFHDLVKEGARGRLEIAQAGRRAIGRVVEEHDELIDRYDVYRDVVIRPKAGGARLEAKFGTLSGADYRVAVYKQLDLDPYRSVFLLTLLSGDLDEELKGKKWADLIVDERFFEQLLAPAIDHAELEPGQIEQVIAEGSQYLARTRAQQSRAAYSKQVLDRVKTIQAFPRPALREPGPPPPAVLGVKGTPANDEARAEAQAEVDALAPAAIEGESEAPAESEARPEGKAEVEGQQPSPGGSSRMTKPSEPPPATGSRRRPFRRAARSTSDTRPPGPGPDHPTGKGQDDDGWL